MQPSTTQQDRSTPWQQAASRASHPAALGQTIAEAGSADVDPGRERRGLLKAIAEGLAAVSVPWDLTHDDPPTERRYERLLSTHTYDAWLIYWPTGTGLDAHDHGGSGGAVAVVAGSLEEEVLGPDGPLRRHIRPGRPVQFGPDHVHAVRNVGFTGATSVHVYSPPLRTMGHYEPSGAGDLVLARSQDWEERSA